MKILHLLPSLNLHGGTPAKIKLLIEKSRHKHYIYCPSSYEPLSDYYANKKKFEAANIEIFEGFFGKNIIRQVFSILKVAKEKEITIINTYFNYEIALASFIKILLPDIKVVQSFVGNIKPRSKVEKLILTAALKYVNSCIYISKYVQKSKQKQFSFLLRKPGQVIYNSFIPKNHKGNGLMIEKERQLVCISGLNIHKNLTVLINAISILKLKYQSDYTLYILGDGPLRPMLEAKIYSLGLGEQVKLIGFCDNTEEYLKNSEIYVHSADNEGLGISVLEAMYNRKPVILSNAGALPEIVDNGTSGILADPYNAEDWADKIYSLSKDKKLRKLIGDNGSLRVNQFFSVERFVKHHDDLYESLCIM